MGKIIGIDLVKEPQKNYYLFLIYIMLLKLTRCAF